MHARVRLCVCVCVCVCVSTHLDNTKVEVGEDKQRTVHLYAHVTYHTRPLLHVAGA